MKPETVIGEAARLRAEKRTAEARAMLEGLLRTAPRHVGALLYLGQILEELGETDLALARYRLAAETAGSHPKPWTAFVTALLRAGQKGRARSVAAKAPVAGPDRKALIELAAKGPQQRVMTLAGASWEAVRAVQAAFEAGRLVEARAEADRLVANHPGSPYLLNLLATIAAAEGDRATAERCLAEAIRREPHYIEARINLGTLLTGQSRFELAVTAYQDALSVEPGSLTARWGLAQALQAAGFHTEALIEIGKILAVDPDHQAALALKAQVQSDVGEHAAAVETLRRLEGIMGDAFDRAGLMIAELAIAESPEAALAYGQRWLSHGPDVRQHYAMVLGQVGRIDEALDLLRSVMDEAPENPGTYRTYALYVKWTPEDPAFRRLEALQSDLSLPNSERWPLVFAYAGALLSMRRHKEAFAALDRANALQREGLDPSAHRDSLAFTRMPSIWTQRAIDGLKGIGDETVAPIFVVGMPRSGSTMTEQILAAHPDIQALGEDSVVRPYFPTNMPADRNAMVKASRAGARALRDASGGRARVTDKLLGNFQVIGPLATAFPRARFVHTVRDPRAIALSIYQNAFRVHGHPYSTRLDWLAEYYIAYHRLIAYWHDTFRDRIFDTEYESMVADPEPQVRALISWLGLPWNDACLSPEGVQRQIRTLSVSQVRAPINEASRRRWAVFEEELRPFTEILEREGVLKSEAA